MEHSFHLIVLTLGHNEIRFLEVLSHPKPVGYYHMKPSMQWLFESDISGLLFTGGDWNRVYIFTKYEFQQ